MKKHPIHINRHNINDMLPDMPESFRAEMQYLVEGMPYREKEKPMKRKLSVGLVFAIVLMIAAVTALAAISLRAYYERTIEQTAQSGLVQDWDADEKVQLVDWMVAAGLELDADQVARLHDGSLSPMEQAALAMEIISGYYPARQGALTVVDIIAKEKGPFESWSIEDKAWLTQMLYQYGEPAHSSLYFYSLMPDSSLGDISKEEAIQTARGVLKQQYGLTDNDLDGMKLNEYFELAVDMSYLLPGETERQEGTLRLWMIRYFPQGIDSEYWVNMRNDGVVLEYGRPVEQSQVYEASVSIQEIKAMVEDPDFWTYENAATFRETYRPILTDLREGGVDVPNWLIRLSEIPYGMPSANDISDTEARDIALGAILKRSGWSEENLPIYYKSSVTYRVYGGESPIWRVCYKIAKIDDYPLVREGKLPFSIVVNIEAASGKIQMVFEEALEPTSEFLTEFPASPDDIPQGVG